MASEIIFISYYFKEAQSFYYGTRKNKKEQAKLRTPIIDSIYEKMESSESDSDPNTVIKSIAAVWFFF